MQQYEFHAYTANDNGAVATDPTVTVERLPNEAAARGHAGRIAKRIDGPVDLALAGGAPWADRYITTANPSDAHATGFRCERLES